jgi:hypothetical protein
MTRPTTENPLVKARLLVTSQTESNIPDWSLMLAEVGVPDPSQAQIRLIRGSSVQVVPQHLGP